MKKISVGLQLYTVRDRCAKDFVGTLKKVAKMGYKGVELHDTYSLSGVKLRKMLDDLGLKCAGNHMSRERDLRKIIDLNSELGCSYVWGPCLPEDKLPAGFLLPSPNFRLYWLLLCAYEKNQPLSSNLDYPPSGKFQLPAPGG